MATTADFFLSSLTVLGDDAIDRIVVIDREVSTSGTARTSHAETPAPSVTGPIALAPAALDSGPIALAPPVFDDNPNTYNGAPGAETINSLGGDDNINGAGGDDEIYGGKGVDTLHGGEGND